MSEELKYGKVMALYLEKDELAALRTKLEEAERKVYVPGLWRCAKCKLDLIATTLSQQGHSANNNPQACPNGCGPMWRVTERDQRQEAQMLFEREFNARQEAERKLAVAVFDRDAYKHSMEMATFREAKARAEGMEEAAKVCDEIAHQWRGANTQASECVVAIRAKMKEVK